MDKLLDTLAEQQQWSIDTITKLEQQIKNIRIWYGINQVHIPSKEAKKMIGILQRGEDYTYG